MKKILLVILVSLGGAGILLISMSRATLEVMMRDDRDGRLRVEPVIIADKTIYKLPQTNLLPNNIFYKVKEVRDWLWLKFSSGTEEKVRIELILADKRIAEARALVKLKDYRRAFEAGMEAINKLKYARGLLDKEKQVQPIAQKQLDVQITNTAVAYSEIIKEIGSQIGSNQQKYNLLQKEIDDFKETQIQEQSIEQK